RPGLGGQGEGGDVLDGGEAAPGLDGQGAVALGDGAAGHDRAVGLQRPGDGARVQPGGGERREVDVDCHPLVGRTAELDGAHPVHALQLGHDDGAQRLGGGLLVAGDGDGQLDDGQVVDAAADDLGV